MANHESSIAEPRCPGKHGGHVGGKVILNSVLGNIPSTPQKRPQDLDAVMLGGCSSFVICSFIVYGLGVLPYFLAGDLGSWRALLSATGVGVVTSLMFTGISSRMAGIAAWFGCIGGSLAVGVFLFLTLEKVTPLTRGPNDPPIEWPPSMSIAIPLAWAILVGTLGAATRKKE